MKSATMPSGRRAFVISVALAIASAAAMVWAYSYLDGERQAAAVAATEAGECRILARRIEALRQRPSKQVSAGGAKGELIRRITTAAEAAGFGEGALDRIEPEIQRSNGDAADSQEQAKVYLKKVTLRQAVAFFHDLDSSGVLSVVRLRLVAPADTKAAGEDLWVVEATLGRGAGGGLPQAARAEARP